MKPPAPHVLIVGHGTIATFLGIALQSTDSEVWHLIRGDEQPLPVRVAFQDRRLAQFHQEASEYAYRMLPDRWEMGEFDWIILAVGEHDMPSLMAEIGPFLTPQQHLLTMGNVWHAYESLDQYAKGQYLLGFPHFGGVLAEGTLTGWLTEHITIGEPDGSMSERAGEMQQLLFEAGFNPEIRPDMKDWLAVHFAWNSSLMTAVAEAGGYAALANDWKAMIHGFQRCRKLMQQLRDQGIPTERYPDGRKAFRPHWFNAIRFWLMLHVPGLAKRKDLIQKPQELKSYWQAIPAEPITA